MHLCKLSLTLALLFVLSSNALAQECTPWKKTALEDRNEVDDLLPNGTLAAEPREHSIVIWARTEDAQKLRLHWQAGPECTPQKSSWQRTKEEDFFTHSFNLDELEAGRQYKYWIEIKGQGDSSPGWFKTTPEKDEPFRLAFSADVSKKKKYYSIYPHLTAIAADYYIAMGDWPNSDGAGPVSGIDVFRSKHSRLREHPAIQKWMKSIAIGAIWDDHEVRNNWDGELAEDFPEVVQEGVSVWHEFFPVLDAPAGEIYRTHMVGPQVQVFLLDLRSHRSADKAKDDSSKTMLGEEQKQWLFEALKASTATFKIVVTSVSFYHGTTGTDHWEGFTTEREEFFDFIADEHIENIVFIAADQHWLSVQHLPQGMKFYQVGPLAHKTRNPKRGVPEWVRLTHRAMNFGYFDYTPATPDAPASLQFTAFGNATEDKYNTDDPTVLYQETLYAGTGVLEIEDTGAFIQWMTEGAHTFVGNDSKTLTMAPIGDYTLTWRHLVPGLVELPKQAFQLAPGEHKSLTGPDPKILPEPVYRETFNSDPRERGWTVLDQGLANPDSNWQVDHGMMIESGNCYDEEDTESKSEKKKRKAAGLPKTLCAP